MEKSLFLNQTQTNSSSSLNISMSSPYHSKQASQAPLVQDTRNFGYATGRLVRVLFNHVYDAWQKWWHAPTAEVLAQRRQITIYREGLKLAVNQLDLAIEDLSKNPRAASSLERFKQMVNEYKKFFEPAPLEKSRIHQARLLNPIRTKVQRLKIAGLREMILAYLPIIQTERPSSDPVLPVPEKPPSSSENKRFILQQPAPAFSPMVPAPSNPIFPPSFDLNILNGGNGFEVEGLNPNDHLGNCVSSVGDVNGDGHNDLVLSAYFASPNNMARAGTVYVLFGQENGWNAQFNLSNLNGNNGFIIEGLDANDNLGFSVSTAGDFNGDSKDDLVLGADFSSPGGRGLAGTVYVVFGQMSGWTSHFNLTILNGTNGFIIEGPSSGDRLGYTISMGDINNDGRADIILGAYDSSPGGRNNAGTAYVLFGQVSGWTSYFNLTNLNGTNGFIVEGLNPSDNLGYSVSTVGDINGDGTTDMALGAISTSPNETSAAGTTYVLFGKTIGWPAKFNLTTLNGANGFAINGLSSGDGLGSSISTAGDMTGDNISDLVIAAGFASPYGLSDAGTVYVLFGQTNGWSSYFNLATLNGSNGFAVNGINATDSLGYSVGTAGDINGDGKSDIVLGANGRSIFNGSGVGAAYVLFGRASGWSSPFNLTSLNGTNGFTVDGVNSGDNLGASVDTAGDLNGDGITDLALGATGASRSGRAYAGAAYVIFGKGTSINPLPSSSPSPNISPQPIISPNPSISSIPAPNALPSPFIKLNLTACSMNQPLQWLYHSIVIAKSQALRLSPDDIAARCGNFSNQPYLGTSFTVTDIQSAALQQLNASGFWNAGVLTFLGKDLALGRISLVQNGSNNAPALNITATDGLTILSDQSVQVNFTLTDNPPTIIGFLLTPVTGNQLTLSTGNLLVTADGKLTNLVFTVEGVQNGYFAQINAPDVPISEFTYYQIQTGQIQLVQNNSAPIQFTITASDGLKSSVPTSQILDLFGTADDQVSKTGMIAGLSISAGIMAVGSTAALICGYYKRQQDRERKQEKENYGQWAKSTQSRPKPEDTTGSHDVISEYNVEMTELTDNRATLSS